MNNHFRKESRFKKAGILAIAIMVLSLTSAKLFAQTDTMNKQNVPMQTQPAKPSINPQTNPNQNPNLNQNPNNLPETKPMQTTPKMDTSGHKTMGKLTDAQIKAIVGSDKPAGKDSQGHQLYKDADGRTYYVSDDGKKVYVPK